MRESLRVRLVLWYALVLTLVVALYGGAVCYQTWRTRVAGADTELAGHARELANALRPAGDGRFDLELTTDVEEYLDQGSHRPYYIIRNADGETIDRSDAAPPNSGTQEPRRTREVTVDGPQGAKVTFGRDIADLHSAQWGLTLNVVLAGAATLALSIFGGWFVAGRALAPIAKISKVAQAMSAGDLNARIAVDRTETELEQVASSLNHAFDRLTQAVEQERRFTADASHELRTPISVLRAEADWALDRDRTPQEYKDSLTVCRRAALRMQDVVSRLLALARAESVQRVDTVADVPLAPLVHDVARWLAPMAQERAIRIRVDAEPLIVKGDPALLREAVSNLVTNAILYNKAGGSVTIAARSVGDNARIEVIDTGIGIPAAAIPHVFDRFYRVDKARSREGGGSGLGLSIARAIAVAHDGDISCTSEEGTGSVFAITVPRQRVTEHASALT